MVSLNPFEWISGALRRCLNSQAQMILGRMSPEGRAASRALVQWVEVAAERRLRRERVEKALAKISPTGRLQNRGFRAWWKFADEARRRKNKIKEALARMTPEGQAKHRGMSCFKSRNPFWELGPERVVSNDGFWVTSTRVHGERESVFGKPEIGGSGVFRFAFTINGSGAGMVVGVADATDRKMMITNPDDVRAWGLHLTHGALFSKREKSLKGVLSNKQLVPSMAPETPDDDPDTGMFVENVIDVEVEVDMYRRRLAFGLPGGPLVEAPVKLPASVRPWAYLWNDADSVMVDSRAQLRDGRNARKTQSLNQRQPATIAAPVPLRSQLSTNVLGSYVGPDIPTHLLGPRIPSHAERGDYLPPHVYGSDNQMSVPEARAYSARVRPSRTVAGLRSARNVVVATKRAMSPGRSRGGGPSGGRLEALEEAATPSATASGEKVVGAQEEEGGDANGLIHAGADDADAMRTPSRRPTPGSTATGRSMAASLRTARSRSPGGLHSPRSPRGKGITHMWDVVRYVSGVYGEVHKQID